MRRKKHFKKPLIMLPVRLNFRNYLKISIYVVYLFLFVVMLFVLRAIYVSSFCYPKTTTTCNRVYPQGWLANIISTIYLGLYLLYSGIFTKRNNLFLYIIMYIGTFTRFVFLVLYTLNQFVSPQGLVVKYKTKKKKTKKK